MYSILTKSRYLKLISKLLLLLISALAIFIIVSIPSQASESNNEFNNESYRFVDMWPRLPQPWYFSPEGIAIDSQGNIYIADTYKHQIQKFT